MEKKRKRDLPDSGLTMKRWDVAGLASKGIRSAAAWSRSRAEANPEGFLVSRAAVASA